ncbi:MAG: serine hydrolase, partial [Rufibacter sp.]
MMKKLTLLFVSLLVLGQSSFAQTGVTDPLLAEFDARANAFLQKHFNVPGLTMAVSKDGKLIYSKAFGFSDREMKVPASPNNLFRISDLSKQITSIAIMKLVEDKGLNLNSTVFGPGGILGSHPFITQAAITDQRVFNITVQQLLELTAGWRPQGNCFNSNVSPYPADWNFGTCDPLYVPLHVAQKYGLSKVTEEAQIRFAVERGLDFDPGTSWGYYGINYLILGEIIEQLSGMSYEAYVKSAILHPLGIYDMHIGKSLMKDKLEREVEYTSNGGGSLSSYGTGEVVEWPYGGWNLETMGPNVGWVATAKDILRLLSAVDGFSAKPDILTAASLATMTTSTLNNQYAKGWSVWAKAQAPNPLDGAWWHFGENIDGSAAFIARLPSGWSYVIITNSMKGQSGFWADLETLAPNSINAVANAGGGFPTYDLMASPTINSKDITFSNTRSTSVNVTWTNGNGDKRLVVVSQGETPVAAYPLEGQNYTADAAFTSGANLGSGAYVAYNGTGNSVTITGLSPETAYTVKVYEYNQNSTTGNHALYLLGQSAKASFTTPNALGVASEVESKAIRVFPNPSNGEINIDLTALHAGAAKGADITITNLQGVSVLKGTLGGKSGSLNANSLASGMYVLKI